MAESLTYIEYLGRFPYTSTGNFIISVVISFFLIIACCWMVIALIVRRGSWIFAFFLGLLLFTGISISTWFVTNNSYQTHMILANREEEWAQVRQAGEDFSKALSAYIQDDETLQENVRLVNQYLHTGDDLTIGTLKDEREQLLLSVDEVYPKIMDENKLLGNDRTRLIDAKNAYEQAVEAYFET